MAGTRDPWPAIWVRKLKKYRRWAEEMKEYGFEVTEPPNADKPPVRRIAETS